MPSPNQNIPLPNAVPRSAGDKAGESVSILDFASAADAAWDPAFNRAVTAVNTRGRTTGAEIYFPGPNTYMFNNPGTIPFGCIPLRIYGDTTATMIKRGATMPAGKGMLDVYSNDVQFENLTIDGNVTASVGLLYSAFAGDPMNALLTTNTSFWIHGGCNRIKFRNVTVQHTGGYSILLDATTGAINDVFILDCAFTNNRPHLFGTSSGDLNYGSWTGGVHYQGDGVLYGVNKLIVNRCSFDRCTGNTVWGHLYAFGKLHTNISVIANTFLDIGLDAVLYGGVDGGVCANNKFRRIGYIATADTGATTPRYLAAAFAVGIDTSGVVENVNYSDNELQSVNGNYINLDGFCRGTVSDNACMTPLPGDLAYIEDSIATWGPGNLGQNWSQGIITGISAFGVSGAYAIGSDISIVNNELVNCGGGAIGLFGCTGAYVAGNHIDHYPSAAILVGGKPIPPIVIGNLGSAVGQRSVSNLITKNWIKYNPVAIQPCIFEFQNGFPFHTGDANIVSGNHMLTAVGNAYEFQADPNTSSSTAVVFSTRTAVAVGSAHFIQREGQASDSTSALRFYVQESNANPRLHMQLQGYSRAGIQHPLLNVSDNGTAGTGVFATGSITQTVFDHCVVTGKLYGTAFLALTDTEYSDADANLLAGTTALLKWDNTLHVWRQSITTSGGNRVWSNFVGIPAGSDKQVQYNKANVFGADANLTWDYTNQLLTIYGVHGAAAITVGNASGAQDSYIQSNGGFLAFGTLNYNAIQAPVGGVACAGLSLIPTASTGGYMHLAPLTLATPGALSGDTTLSTQAYMYFSTFGSQSIWYHKMIGGVYAFDGQLTDTITGFKLGKFSSPSSNRIVNIDFLTDATFTDFGLRLLRDSVTGGAGANANAMLANNGTGNLRLWQTNGTVVLSTGTSGGNPIDRVFVDVNGNFWVKDSAHFQVDQNGNTTAVGVFQATGNTGSGTGFNVLHALDFNSIQTTGGVYGRSGMTVDQAYYMKQFGSATMNSPGTGYGGLTWQGGSVFWYWNGSSWSSVNLAAIGGGVTTLNGFSGAVGISNGTGVSITNSANVITISIGQAVGTGNAVTFFSVLTTDAIQSNRSTSPAFNAPNASMQAKGFNCVSLSAKNSIQSSSGISAGIDANGGYWINAGATKVINTNGIFCGNGILMQSGVGAPGYNFYVSAVGATWNFRGGGTDTINIPAGNTYTFEGGILTQKNGVPYNSFSVAAP